MSIYRYLMVLSLSVRHVVYRLLHLAKRFGPKRAFFSCKREYKTHVVYRLLHLAKRFGPKRPFWGRNVLLSEAVYIPRVLRSIKEPSSTYTYNYIVNNITVTVNRMPHTVNW